MKEMYVDGPTEKADVMHPRISIPLDALPEAKDWKVGQTYDVTVRLKQTGMHLSKGEGREGGEATFDLVGIQPHGKIRAPKPKKKPARYPRMKV